MSRSGRPQFIIPLWLHAGRTLWSGLTDCLLGWLQGDVKERLCQYAEEQSIDLIVVLTAGAGSKLRKGYNLSSHLQHHAPCPVLTIPIRTLGLPVSTFTCSHSPFHGPIFG